MLHLVFTVHDSCSGVYDRPFVGRSEGDAVRSFGDIAMDAEHPIGKHPEHFSLYRLGSYDDNTGKLDPCTPVHVVSAVDLISASRKISAGSLKEVGNA